MGKALVSGVIKVSKKYISSAVLKAYTYTKPAFGGEAPEIVYNYYKTKAEYWLPRNIKKFKSLVTNVPLKYELTEGIPIDIKWNDGYSLYEYQKPFVNSILDTLMGDTNCLAQAATRFGKTASAFGVVQKLECSTIILVDKTLLLNQFIDDFTEYGQVDVGQLDKSGNLHDVTVTTFQYLNANPELLKEIKDEFGMLIVDELHVSAATTFKRIIQSFPTRYRLGLTATPTRSSDRLTGVLTDLFGEVAVVGENPNDMTVHWYSHKLSESYKPSSYNPSASYNKYYTQQKVSEDIASLLLFYLQEDRTIMISTGSKKVQNHYIDLLKNLNIDGCVFNSEPKNKKAQDENLELVKDGKVKVFSGLNVMIKGVSIPRLSVVLNLMSIGSEENLAQLLGRLKTKLDDKPTPLFINVNPKWGTYKTDKIDELLELMDNVVHEK